MNTRDSLLLAALAGFAGGFVAGMLLAPESGRASRRRIAQQVRHSTRWMEDQLQQVEGHLDRLEDQISDVGTGLGDRIRTAVDQIVPGVPEEEDFGVERDDLAQDLRHLPRQ